MKKVQLNIRRYVILILSVVSLMASIGIAAGPHHNSGHNQKHQKHVSHNSKKFHKPGHRVTVLPKGYVRLSLGNHFFHYHGGVFFSSRGGGFVVVAAPVGARVKYLPSGYTRIVVGHRHYFHINATYFLWEPATKNYVVVEKPADEGVAATHLSQTQTLIIYPKQGQSDTQRATDKAHCELWAANETATDKTLTLEQRLVKPNYYRAMVACLEGQGYSVK
jgi:Family of unknown function (DUF6515)